MEWVAVCEDECGELPTLVQLLELLPDPLGAERSCREKYLMFRTRIERITFTKHSEFAQIERRLPGVGKLTNVQIIEKMVDAAWSQWRCTRCLFFWKVRGEHP